MKKENHIKSILHMPSLTQSGEKVPTMKETGRTGLFKSCCSSIEGDESSGGKAEGRNIYKHLFCFVLIPQAQTFNQCVFYSPA